MSHIGSAADMYRHLAQECEMAMALVDVLFEEQSCLIRFETDRLQALALKKEAMMLELEKRYLNNLQMARAEGYSPDFEGLARWIDNLSHREKRLNSTFETLKTTLQQAKHLNEANGNIVAEQMASLQERISILTAAAIGNTGASPAANTYGPQGALNKSGNAGTTPRAVIR